MTLSLEQTHEIIYNEEDIIAIRQGGAVEIWGSDGESFLGTIPENSTSETVKMILVFFHRGYLEGKQRGRIEIQVALRQLIGSDQ
jgi:hypothetical protein